MRKGKLLTFLLGGLTVLGCGGMATLMVLSCVGAVSVTNPDKTYCCDFFNYDESFLYRTNVKPDGTATYYGVTPTKESDSLYSYRFSGWDKSLSHIGGDTKFYAEFTEIKRDYVIKFVNYDGEELYTQEVEAGQKPFYAGPTPTRQDSSNAIYSFIGWDHEIVPAFSNDSYVAQYEENSVYHHVVFGNYDNTFLYEDDVLNHGTALYKGETPKREPDEDGYIYKFIGWDKPIDNITEDTNFFAEFEKVAEEYTVTFKNYDGSILEVDSVTAGSSATFHGSTPVRPSDDNGHYTFSGWDKVLTSITEDTETTAQFVADEPECTIEFRNYDGTTLYTTTVEYNSDAIYKGEEPTKPSDEHFDYKFIGWDRDIDNVKSSFFTIALFESYCRKYEVTFANYDGEVLESVTVDYGTDASKLYSLGKPTRPEDEYYTYEFLCWNEDLTYIDSDITTYAIYDAIPKRKTKGDDEGHGGEGSGTGGDGEGEGPGGGGGGSGSGASGLLCSVSFYNYDCKYIDSDVVLVGNDAYCEAPTPTRPADYLHTNYIFCSWDKPITNVKQSFTTYAQYYVDDGLFEQYIVTFRNDDGSILYEDFCYENEMPEYGVNTDPVSGAAFGSNDVIAVFVGWDRQITPANTSYTLYAKYVYFPISSVTGGGISGEPNPKQGEPVLSVQTKYKGEIHLRERSYGELEDNIWLDPTIYPSVQKGSLSPLYYTSDLVKQTNLTTYALDVNYVDYPAYPGLPMYSKTELENHCDDTVNAYQEEKDFSYEFTPFELNDNSYYLLNNINYSSSQLSDEEKEYYKFVKENYLSIDSSQKEFLDDFIRDNNLSSSTIKDIVDVKDFLKKYAKYNPKFDPIAPGSDYVIHFLQDSKEGICNHFASALTLLYRDLGIPARFVTGYLVNSKGDNVPQTVTGDDAHAWTEIYLPTIGWVYMDATPPFDNPGGGGGEGGEKLPFNPFGPVDGTPDIVIHVQAESETKAYDGTPMHIFATMEGQLDKGDKINLNILENDFSVGKYVCRATPRIVNSDNKDVTEKYEGRVQIDWGTYEITTQNLVVRTCDATKKRDGTPLVCHEYEILQGALASGETLVVEFTGELLRPGTCVNSIDFGATQIVSTNYGYTTNNYCITWQFGTLRII